MNIRTGVTLGLAALGVGSMFAGAAMTRQDGQRSSVMSQLLVVAGGASLGASMLMGRGSMRFMATSYAAGMGALFGGMAVSEHSGRRASFTPPPLDIDRPPTRFGSDILLPAGKP